MCYPDQRYYITFFFQLYRDFQKSMTVAIKGMAKWGGTLNKAMTMKVKNMRKSVMAFANMFIVVVNNHLSRGSQFLSISHRF